MNYFNEGNAWFFLNNFQPMPTLNLKRSSLCFKQEKYDEYFRLESHPPSPCREGALTDLKNFTLFFMLESHFTKPSFRYTRVIFD